MKRIFLLAASASLLCAPLFAQTENPRYEAGFTAGVGAYSYFDDHAHARAVFGAELCAFCGGRYALFGDYRHFLAPGAPSGYRSADLVNAGLRIQGRGRVSAFFDVGFAAGSSRYSWRSGVKAMGTAGAGLGGGVTFRTAKGLYIRPQVRIYVMSEAYVAAETEVGIGWRF